MTRRRSDPFLCEPPSQAQRLLRGLVIAVLLLALWFVAVDLSWFVEHCDDCHYDKDRLELRLFGFEVHTWERVHDSFFHAAAADLGVPCPHLGWQRWHKHRYWGLLICADPCINGISLITGDEAEWPPYLNEMRVLADEDPEFRHEFFQRVLMEHDHDYARMLWEEMRCRIDAAEFASASTAAFDASCPAD